MGEKGRRALDRSVFLDADRLALTDCQEETFHKSKTLDRVLLGLRRLYAGGAKTCSYRVLRVSFFLPPYGGRRQERAGPDRTNGNGDRGREEKHRPIDAG